MNLLKLASVFAFTLSLIACNTAEKKVAATQGEAKTSIAAAKASVKNATGANGAWRDTGKIIGKAEAALKAGDFTKAKALADSADDQSAYAIYQAKVENAKFEDIKATKFD